MQCILNSKKECEIYYFSKRVDAYKANYNFIGKTYVTVVWVYQKLRHYMAVFQVWLITYMNPLKYLIEHPMLTKKLLRCKAVIAKFDIKYTTQSSTKQIAVEKYLVSYPIPCNEQFECQFLDGAIIKKEA